MRKLKEFYGEYQHKVDFNQDTYRNNSIYVIIAFNRLVAEGIVKEIEMTEKEFECFLHGYKDDIIQNTDVTSGKFTFWGVKIVKK